LLRILHSAVIERRGRIDSFVILYLLADVLGVWIENSGLACVFHVIGKFLIGL